MSFPAKRVRYGTKEEYDKTATTFRETQQSKSRYYYHGETINGDRVEWTTPRKMTNSWRKLQGEYNTRKRSKRRHDTLYFVV